MDVKCISINVKGKKCENWLDNVPTSEIKKFAIQNLEEECLEGATLSRSYVGNTKHTLKVQLLKHGNPIYDFSPYFISKSNDFGNVFDLDDLQKEWMMFIAQYNEDKKINGKTYYESAIEMLNEVFYQSPNIEEFVQSLELINLL